LTPFIAGENSITGTLTEEARRLTAPGVLREASEISRDLAVELDQVVLLSERHMTGRPTLRKHSQSPKAGVVHMDHI